MHAVGMDAPLSPPPVLREFFSNPLVRRTLWPRPLAYAHDFQRTAVASPCEPLLHAAAGYVTWSRLASTPASTVHVRVAARGRRMRATGNVRPTFRRRRSYAHLAKHNLPLQAQLLDDP